MWFKLGYRNYLAMTWASWPTWLMTWASRLFRANFLYEIEKPYMYNIYRYVFNIYNIYNIHIIYIIIYMCIYIIYILLRNYENNVPSQLSPLHCSHALGYTMLLTHSWYQWTKKLNNKPSKDSRVVVTTVAVAIRVLWW